jgi:sugar phosphate isomerase/epimerase
MAKSNIAAQLYTLRDFCRTPEDIAKTFKKLKEIGYEAVQVSGMGPIAPDQLKKIADDNGLEICATHIGYQRLKDDIEGVIADHKLWNCKYVGLGSMPEEYRSSKEGFIRFAKEASVIAKKLQEAGLSFVYHNHDFEFVKFDGKIGLDIIFEESDKSAFNAEIDTYWVQSGGSDPAAWIRKMKGRMDIVHLKDMVMDIKKGRIMAEVGEGNLNWPAILDACREIGIKWYIVEQDVCQRDPFESLAISLENLKKMGLQ